MSYGIEQLFIDDYLDTNWFMSPILQTINDTEQYTPKQKHLLEMTELVVGSLSIAFTLLYIIYVLLRSLYTFPWKHLFHYFCKRRTSNLSFKQLFSTVCNECYIFAKPVARIFFVMQFYECMFATYILTEESTAACYYQFFVTQFFGLAKFAWTLVVAVWMFWILVIKKKNKLLLLEILSHLFVLTTASVLTILPLASNAVGSTGYYCWIKGGTPWFRFMRMTYYVPLWTIMALIILIYLITAMIMIHTQYKSLSNRTVARKLTYAASTSKLYLKLVGLPMLFLLSRIIVTIRYIWRSVTGNIPFVLEEIFCFVSPSTGMLYTLLIALSEFIALLRYPARRRELGLYAPNTQEEYEQLSDPIPTTEYIAWEYKEDEQHTM
jgi:hypothetical protein